MTVHREVLPPDFAEALARATPRFGRLGTEILYFPEIDSTNNVAAKLASTGPCEGAIVVAGAQTAGRGRRGRSWFSPAGAGLYVSVVLEPSGAADVERATALVTLAAGVALAEGIERATGFAPAIKWPNDLIAGRRKIAGILAEGIARPSRAEHGSARVAAVVLGYGINVSTSAFPPELSDRASSLEGELGRTIDSAQLCAESIAALAARYEDLLAGRFDAILDAWRGRAPASRGARVQWETPDGVRRGTTAGVDETGALLVRTHGAIERLVAGEVTWA